MTIALMLTIAAVVYLAAAFAAQRSVLFPKPPVPRVSIGDARPDVEVVWLGPDRGVEAWFLPPRAGSRPAPALLFAHGNGELIDYWPDQFEELRDWGIGVLLLEYPGYGRSAGRTTEASVAAAARAAYDYLAGRPDVDARRIVAYGRSVGGGPASALARDRGIAALVLESAFTSVRDLARRYGLVGPLVLDPFENLAAVEAFDGPVLVIHGNADRLIPVSHGRRLAGAAAHGELVELECGHNDCPRPWRIMRDFLTRHGVLEPPVQAAPGSLSTSPR